MSNAYAIGELMRWTTEKFVALLPFVHLPAKANTSVHMPSTGIT